MHHFERGKKRGTCVTLKEEKNAACASLLEAGKARYMCCCFPLVKTMVQSVWKHPPKEKLTLKSLILFEFEIVHRARNEDDMMEQDQQDDLSRIIPVGLLPGILSRCVKNASCFFKNILWLDQKHVPGL